MANARDTLKMLRRAREVAEELQGTPRSIPEFATAEEADDEVFLGELDQHVFECTVCGWWCEVSEMSEKHEDFVCTDCEDD